MPLSPRVTDFPPSGPARPSPGALRVALVLSAAAFGLYLFTAAPDLGLVDSAELALTCATGGVPHPPGVPLYRLLGGLFANLPVSTPARALNLMSAFFAALAVGATFLAAERLLAFRDTAGALRPRMLAAATAAAIFATASSSAITSTPPTQIGQRLGAT